MDEEFEWFVGQPIGNDLTLRKIIDEWAGEYTGDPAAADREIRAGIKALLEQYRKKVGAIY